MLLRSSANFRFILYLSLFGDILCQYEPYPPYSGPTPQYGPRPYQQAPYQYQSSYGYQPSYREEDEEYYYNKGREVMDYEGNYVLEWEVDYKGKMIVFNITVVHTGWVGLGLSKTGSMNGADIVIGGIKSGGLAYLMDMYADYSHRCYTDSQNDWTMLFAYEKGGTTFLSIARALDSCDPNDHPITEDLVHVLWAYGESDYLDYHFDKRGTFRVYLLDPIVETVETPLEMWRISKETTTQPKPTSYWCTIHQAPVLTQKHHIVEQHVFLENELALNHVHHILVFRCVPPPGLEADVVFAPFVAHPGEECYFNDNHIIPVNLCRDMVAVWAIGGHPFKLPYSTGIPLGESPTEYFMLELHYNNPEKLELTINAGLDFYYTDQLREHDGIYIMAGYDVFGLFIVPPISQYFEIYGFCTPDCTRTMIPEEGVEIVAVALHSHNSGRKMKLQHFRDNYELPWILKDENFDNTFQQTRPLYYPRLLLPGDQLVMRCNYDNTWTNKTVVSGFSTREEMCLAILLITKRIPYVVCFSQVPGENFLPYIGVDDTKWDTESQARVVTAPPELAGTPLSHILDYKTNWSKWLRYKYQEIFLSSTQSGSCPQILIPSNRDGVLSTNLVSIATTAEEMLAMATAFGTTTLMGTERGVPNRSPGPVSFADYPVDARRKYMPGRYCPKPYSPFGVSKY